MWHTQIATLCGTHKWQPYVAHTNGSLMWHTQIAALCGTHKWQPYVAHTNGSLMWHTQMAALCGTHKWLPYVAHTNGSLMWHTQMAALCGTHKWLPYVAHTNPVLMNFYGFRSSDAIVLYPWHDSNSQSHGYSVCSTKIDKIVFIDFGKFVCVSSSVCRQTDAMAWEPIDIYFVEGWLFS